LLNVGDHPFIKHESVINFSDARELNIEELEKLLQAKTHFVCKQLEPCSEALISKIQQGLVASKLTPRGIKEHCRRVWKL
jgi:hypothetical protein